MMKDGVDKEQDCCGGKCLMRCKPERVTNTRNGDTPLTDAHLSHLNLPDGRKVGIPDQTVELLRQLERELAEVYDMRGEVPILRSSTAFTNEELDRANVGLADEAARMRLALGELVDAADAFENREEMTAAQEEAAEQRFETAMKAARPFTEKALMERTLSATAFTPEEAENLRNVKADSPFAMMESLRLKLEAIGALPRAADRSES